MVRGESIMYYVHYDSDFNITSVGNTSNTNEYCLQIDEQLFNDFNNGQKQMIDYKVAQDIKIKGIFHVVPIDFSVQKFDSHQTGLIKKQDSKLDNSIQIVQNSSSWIVNNVMDTTTCTALSAGEDHIKEYYIVRSDNRFILLNKFSINLKELAVQEKIIINSKSSITDVSVLTLGSPIEHSHKRNKNENH